MKIKADVTIWYGAIRGSGVFVIVSWSEASSFGPIRHTWDEGGLRWSIAVQAARAVAKEHNLQLRGKAGWYRKAKVPVRIMTNEQVGDCLSDGVIRKMVDDSTVGLGKETL